MPGHGSVSRQSRLLRRLLAGSALALLLAGCQTTASQNSPAYTGSIGDTATVNASDLTEEQALAAVQRWGAAYGRDERDKVASLNYAAALRAAGQAKQAVAVMRKAAIYHPEDREVLAAFGKALAADGAFQEALATVRRAQRADNPDWQLLSTEGGILDSLGDHKGARDRYNQALVLAPGEPQVLNNLGLSYMLTGELDQAETILRKAAASPRATLKIRQNLDLVLNLRKKGATASAAAADGPPAAPPSQPVPAAAAAPQEDTWKELAGQG